MPGTPDPGAGGRWAAALQAAWWQASPNALAQRLRPLCALYGALARLHKALTWPRRLDVPVIVVGNLVVGGAGKTPTVIALVRLLRAYGWTPGVVSRGDGRRTAGVLQVHASSTAGDCGDEPLLIHLRTERRSSSATTASPPRARCAANTRRWTS